MNRIFHARIAWYQYFILGILGVNCFGALWCKLIIVALLLALMLIVVIEMVIHTTYTFTTDQTLELYYGRFLRKKVIPIHDIISVRKCNSMKFGRFSMTNYILIEYGNGKFATAMPVKEREFMELINRSLTTLK